MHNLPYAIDQSAYGLKPGATVRWPVTLFAFVGLVVTAVALIAGQGAL